MPTTMQAMVLDRARTALRAAELPMPEPSPHQLRLRVLACRVCRTDLHIVDGELAQPKLPLVLGHEIVGRVDAMGGEVQGFAAGDRVGVCLASSSRPHPFSRGYACTSPPPDRHRVGLRHTWRKSHSQRPRTYVP